MAAPKQQQQLHQLLQEDQEPFHLTTYISHKRSQFNNPTLHLKKQRKPDTSLKPGNLCRHACFLPFANSPDVRKSPFPDFHSPAAAMSPCKNGAVFLHIPAQITEAAMRIQKQQQQGKSFGLFGSFLKRLKDRSNKSKKRGIGNSVFRKQGKVEKVTTITNVEEKAVDSNRASTSISCCSDHEMLNSADFDVWETRFCVSPFRFSLHQSPLSSGRRTPDFSSPVASPSRLLKQSKEKSEIQDSGNLQEEEEDKEQCSPVSILDPPFEDDEQEGADAEEENYDHEMECSYANVQRAKEQLLFRLRRFEKLAELDPVELERKLLEGSDSDDGELEDSENDEPLLLYTNDNVEAKEAKAFNQSRVHNHSYEEKNEVICLGNREVVLGRVCKRLDFSKDVKFETIDMMIELDFNQDADGWKTLSEEREETVAEIELAIFGLLVDELSEEPCPMEEHDQYLDCVHV